MKKDVIKKKIEVKIINNEVFLISPAKYYSGELYFINSNDELTYNLNDDIKYKIIASSFDLFEIPSINMPTKNIILEYNIDYVYVDFVIKKYIDPASGWKYGFPKLINDENEIDFLLANNYPEELLTLPYSVYNVEDIRVISNYAFIYLDLELIQK